MGEYLKPCHHLKRLYWETQVFENLSNCKWCYLCSGCNRVGGSSWREGKEESGMERDKMGNGIWNPWLCGGELSYLLQHFRRKSLSKGGNRMEYDMMKKISYSYYLLELRIFISNGKVWFFIQYAGISITYQLSKESYTAYVVQIVQCTGHTNSLKLNK
jgi:hypothetical protein